MPNIINNWPYTDLHNINLDWILEKVKSYGEIIEKIPDYIREYIENISIDPATIGTGNQIFVDRFGAVGDGTTNDIAAVNIAIDYCNVHGNTLAFDGSKTYYISGNIHDVNCPINGNGAAIKVDNNTFFRVAAPDSIQSMSLPDIFVSQHRINFPSFYGKSFLLKYPFSLGLRNGTGAEAFYSQMIQLDKDGNIVNGEIPCHTLPAGTYTATHIHSRYVQPISISNIHFDIDTPATGAQFMKIWRNNVTLENILFTGTSAGGGVGIQILGCNIAVKNIAGYNPNIQNNWGYLIALTAADNVVMENVVMDKYTTASWPGMQAEYCGNVSVKNCIMPRFDIHEQAWGNIVIKNSILEFANIAGGVVNYDFNNVQFITTDAKPIYFRGDWGVPLMGKLKATACTGRIDEIFCQYLSYEQTGADTYSDNFTLGAVFEFDTIKASQLFKTVSSPFTVEPVTARAVNCELHPLSQYEGCIRIDDRPNGTIFINGCHFPESCEPANSSAVNPGDNVKNIFISDSIFDNTLWCNKIDNFNISNCKVAYLYGRGAVNVYVDGGQIAGYNQSLARFYWGLKMSAFDVSEWSDKLNNSFMLMVDVTRQDRGQTDHSIIFIPRSDISGTTSYYYGTALIDGQNSYTAVARVNNSGITLYVNKNGSNISADDFTYQLYSM